MKTKINVLLSSLERYGKYAKGKKVLFFAPNYNSRSEFFIVSNMYQNDQVSELLLDGM